ncbi:MAG: hypothetical protein AB1295_01990 [Candidatus Micrarchaeota archaeon]
MAGSAVKSNVILPERYGDIVNKLLTTRQFETLTIADTSKLTLYAVRLAELIDIVMGSRPSTGDKRAAFDDAVRVLGKGNKDTALDTLTKAHAETFKALFSLVQKGGELGQYGAYLNKYFAKITKGIAMGEDDYANYSDAQTAIAGLRSKTLNLKVLIATPTPTTVTVGSNPVQNLAVYLRDIGPVRLVTKKGQREANFILGTPGSEALLMFGETQSSYPNSQAFADAYLNAWSVRDSTDKQGRMTAGTRLADALGRITNTNITGNQNFQDALTLLRAGDIKGAFEKLQSITTLGAAINSLDGRIHTVSVRNKAVAVARAGVAAKFVFRKNWEKFQSTILDGPTGWHQPRVLAVLVGVYYEYLALSGLYQQKQLSLGQETLISQKTLKGAGHVVGFTPQLVMGTAFKDNPLLFTFYCDFGYQQFKVGTNVPTAEGQKWVGAKQETAYMGAWGVQIDRLPGRKGVSPVRIASLGLGSVGDAQNPFVHMITEINYGARTSRFDIKTELTTQYAYWLKTHQVKLGMVPAKMTFKVGKGINLTLGPEFVSNTIIGKDGKLAGYEFTGAAALGLRIERDAADVGLYLKGGYQYGKTVRGEEVASPSSPFVGLQLVITPRTKQLGRR